MKNFIGTIWDSDNFGKFKIIDENENSISDRIFVIEFLDTGYITEANYNAIRHGKVKDKLVPTVANIGYIGSDITITDKDHFIYYKSWNDMMNRCFNIIDGDYPYYGGIGITVDSRWYNFTTFYNDCQLLYNYEKKEMYPDQYQLDKDLLQLHIPKENRIYSRNTCVWLSKADNTMVMTRDNKLGYYGVEYKDHAYCTMIGSKIIGRFIIPQAAAYLFNVLYPKYIENLPFHDIILLNQVKPFTYNELIKYCKGKQCWFNDYPEKE